MMKRLPTGTARPGILILTKVYLSAATMSMEGRTGTSFSTDSKTATSFHAYKWAPILPWRFILPKSKPSVTRMRTEWLDQGRNGRRELAYVNFNAAMPSRSLGLSVCLQDCPRKIVLMALSHVKPEATSQAYL